MRQTIKTTDDTRDLSIKIVDRLVEERLVKNCLDTDDTTEFDVQDIIQEMLNVYFLTPNKTQ